jgi:hypothetical protein
MEIRNYFKIKKTTTDGHDYYIGYYKDPNSQTISNKEFGYDGEYITEFLYNRLKNQGVPHFLKAHVQQYVEE